MHVKFVRVLFGFWGFCNLFIYFKSLRNKTFEKSSSKSKGVFKPKRTSTMELFCEYI